MTTNRVRRMRWALAPLLLGFAVSACSPGDDGRPGRPAGPAIWVEPAAAALGGGEARTLSAAGLEEVFLDAATLERWGSEAPLAPVEGAFDAVPPGTPVTLVVRTPPDGSGAPSEPKAAGRALAAELRTLAAAAEDAGLYPLGVHLEPGEAAGGAPPPPDLLRAIRDPLGDSLLLSITISRDALAGNGDADEETIERAAAAARAVDFVVVFLYGHPADAPDRPAAWDPERMRTDLEALGALGVDFVAGLHVDGSAWHLSSAGERMVGESSAGIDLGVLAADPALRLEIDPFAGDGRLLHTFEAQAPTRVPTGPVPGGAEGGWRLAPGESVRVSWTAPALVRWILDALEEARAGGELDGYRGALFRRLAGEDEPLGFEASEIAASLGALPTAPDLAWRVVVKSRQSGSVVLEIGLENRGRQSTDLAMTEGNYLEIRAQNGHFVAVEPGDFTRYSLWRGEREARPGIGQWREPNGVRLSTPMVKGGERLGGARLTLRTRGGPPRITVGGRFLLTGGEVLEMPVVEGPVEASMSGPSSGSPPVPETAPENGDPSSEAE